MEADSVLDLLTIEVTERTEWRMVRLTLPDGRCGIGEASDSGSRTAAIEALEKLTAHLAGFPVASAVTPADVRAWADEGIDVLPDDRQARAVLGGLEQALCDLAARSADLPVWRWLTGDTASVSAAPVVPCYANINRTPGGRTPADVAQAAADAVAAGFDTIKCAPFDRPDADVPLGTIGLQRLRAAREAVGDDVTLLVDCHVRLPLDALVELLPALHELSPGWIEDAVEVTDLDGLRTLRQETDVPLAGGEFTFDAESLLPAVAEGLLDAVLLDVKHAGGITRTHALAERARSAGNVTITPHNPTGPIGTAASAQLFAATPGASVLELMVGEADWRHAVVRPSEVVTRGRLTLPDAGGLGVALDGHVGRPHVAWSTALEDLA